MSDTLSAVRAVCTICSKDQLDTAEHVPARERYLGRHIGHVERLVKPGDKFFIISAEHGLVPHDKPLMPDPNPLVEARVLPLGDFVASQLGRYKIRSLVFYYEDHPDWHPYCRVIRRACSIAHVEYHDSPIHYNS